MSLKSFLPEYGLDLKTDPKFDLEKNTCKQIPSHDLKFDVCFFVCLFDDV